MNIVVVGAGIIGLTTAYYLRRDGHQVTVLERNNSVGQETSYANGAQLSYNFVTPLAEPSVLTKLPFWLTDKNAPLHFKIRPDMNQWRWGLKFLSLCRTHVTQKYTLSLLKLALESRELYHELMSKEQLDCDFSSKGKLLIYSNEESLSAAARQLQFQATHGGDKYQQLSSEECLKLEPALISSQQTVFGGLFMSKEDSADSYKFCQEMYLRLKNDVHFMFNTDVKKLNASAGKITSLKTSAGELQFDAYVVANGVGAQSLLQRHQANPLVYPLKGYSLTYTLSQESEAPLCSVSDIANKVVYARLGNRLRVAGMVDVGDASKDLNNHRIDLLKKQVSNFFPNLRSLDAPVCWAGLRPARPSSSPLIKQGSLCNLWLNIGHGSLGFTLSTGSAKLLADRIAGRQTQFSDREF
jgi:D-amino-acid dehydrogenase